MHAYHQILQRNVAVDSKVPIYTLALSDLSDETVADLGFSEGGFCYIIAREKIATTPPLG